MVAPGDDMRSSTVVLLSQGKGTSNGGNLFKPDVKQAAGKVKKSTSKQQQQVFTHGLRRQRRFSGDSLVRFMMYSEAASAFVSLHEDNTVCFYNGDGHRQTSSARLPFTGLTTTKMSGCVVGWGPGPVFTLLDRQLRPLDVCDDALDVRVCEEAEHSAELVTAGEGNVCVWSVMLMRCRVKVQEGLQQGTYTHMALAPPRSDRPHTAFVASKGIVTVVDLDAGKVLDHKRDLSSGYITAMTFCSQLDCLITACEELSITIWGPDWEPRTTLLGHNGVVTSLFYCPGLSLLFSASVDCTIRSWNLEAGAVLECVHTGHNNPPLCLVGTRKGDAFFSFSPQGVEFWSINNLYMLHCKFKGDKGVPLRQIKVSPFPGPYPTRVLCLSGDSDLTLVAAKTGSVLTSFQAKQRILCADYCLHKEILLALTETGTVLQANALTNPVTLMQEWKGRGEGPWQREDNVTQSEALDLPLPGPACCLVLYSCVADSERALEEWKSLQANRGCSQRHKSTLDDAKNKFLVILGQSGGCVSVLKLNNGRVMCRMPAHSGQRVTTMKVYPENKCLLSTGEDMRVVVWKVLPHVVECLSQLLSLYCGQPQVHLAGLGSQLALTFPEPHSGTYNLMHYDLLNPKQAGDPSTEGHLDDFTGLCVCPDLEVFVSSSLDGTVLIWNEHNHLIRTLKLNAVPECLAYGGFGGELFLGIKGDLYKMNCAEFLPQNYQQMLFYTYYTQPLPDSPITPTQEKCSKRKKASLDEDEEEVSLEITSNLLCTEDIWRQKECDSLLTTNMDLTALVQDSVKCKKEKPFSTRQTKIEAFDRYMKIIYRLPQSVKVNLEDAFNSKKGVFIPKPFKRKPYVPPPKEEVPPPEPIRVNTPVVVERKKVKVPLPEPEPETPVYVKPVAIPRKLVIVEKKEELPEVIPPIEEPEPRAPTPPAPKPPHFPKVPAPVPQREPSPERPSFLKQFADEDWLKHLYPDKKCIPSTLSAEDVSLQLLGCLNASGGLPKMKVLTALHSMQSQGFLHKPDKLYQGLIELVPKFVSPHMSSLKRSQVIEMLNLLVRLKSASQDLVKKLLTILAFKKLGLQETVLRMLSAFGVYEADQWLWMEVETWASDLKDQPDMWESLHSRAECWLDLWISKYKGREQNLSMSNENWKPSVSMVEVLNYFCEEYRKTRSVAPTGRKNTVLLPLYDSSSYQPILRLGETYSMARIYKPPGIILPPLRNRPFLSQFPHFISLPMPQVTLRPFHIYSDEDWVKAWSRRYFLRQQSYVEYYR